MASAGAKATTGARRCWSRVEGDGDEESRGVLAVIVEAAQTAAEGAAEDSLPLAP